MKETTNNGNALRMLDSVFYIYIVFLTLLLWLPDPRTLLFGWEPGEGPAGFAHVITFSPLGFLAEICRRKRSFFFLATMLLGYTLLTEIVQEILPIRSFDLLDIAQDLAGLYCGFWTAAAVKHIARLGRNP